MKKATILIIFIFAFYFTPVFSQGLDSLIQENMPYILQTLESSTAEIGSHSRHPEKTDTDGSWITHSRDNWTSGFFSGALWYAYALTEEQKWRDAAIAWSADLESRKNNTGTHDVGFQMMSSWGNWYKLTGREDNVPVIIQTANSLSKRFNETIGCTRSWGGVNDNSKFLVIVDNMMNLELLFWAAKNGGDQKYHEMAVRHAETTMQHHVRDDGSTFHVIDFNFDGTVKSKYTHQGYRDWSTWSRGQAWGIYGFVVSYRESGDQRFLDIAQQMADYFINNLPDDFVPYSDFDAPNIPNESKDASAAAITCSALFELNSFVEGDKYRIAAENILTSLLSNYLTKETNLSSILQKGCVRWGSHEQGLIYADYYFLEAIIRYLGIELKPIDPIEPEERLFSDIEFFGDANNYSRFSDYRWSVGEDEGDMRYYINTTGYDNQDGERVGEYSLIKDSLYSDFTLTFKAKSPEDLSANAWADFTIIFGFIDNENYNYAMINSNPAENGNTVFAVRNGARTPIDFIAESGIVDNEYHDYEFTKTGSMIQVKIDGELFYVFDDPELAQSGAVGLGSYNDAVYFDDIMVTRQTDTFAQNDPVSPASFSLLQNYPNPFNMSTTIRFSLPDPVHISIVIYDVSGRVIQTLYEGMHQSGDGAVQWDGQNSHGDMVSSGVYIVTLESENRQVSRKIMLVK